jgi:uncharacterized protein with NRDE domain
MCLALVALDAHPKYRCVIAANRDEFHARAAEPAHWWDEGVLARDLSRRQLVWRHANRPLALITNFARAYRDPYAPSRGSWSACCGGRVRCARAALLPEGGRYHGFNLLVGDDSEVAFASNRASGALARRRHPRLVESPARHPWPKLLRARGAGSHGSRRRPGDRTDLRFLPIASPQPMPISLRPVSPQWKVCSSPFIVSPNTERARRLSC